MVSEVRAPAPSVGACIEIVGAELETEIVIDVDPVAPSASVTLAVMMWVPFGSERTKLPPVPMGPAMSELQRMDPVRSPSSKSLAVALKAIDCRAETVAPSVGE